LARFLALAYGVGCYLFFFLVFLYTIGFVGNFGAPRGIDGGRAEPLVTALLIDAALLGVFAVQHSVMARPAFKAVWTKVVPAPVERSTYVLFASLALALLLWQWRPLATPVIWRVSTPWIEAVLWTLFAVGWLTVLASTFLISHSDLFGLGQVWTFVCGDQTPASEFSTPLFYKVVRHPLYLGFMIAFWATPTMTFGHLVFAIATTAYMFIAIQFEERDLIAVFGERYRRYRSSVSMIVPWVPGKGG
jgi:methanethiol S-methyltransferase